MRGPGLRVSIAALMAIGLASFAAAGDSRGQQPLPVAHGSPVFEESFEGPLAGWLGFHATIAPVSDGIAGRRAVRVSLAGTARDFSIYPASPLIDSPAAGGLYTATAWVRSDTPGREVCLRIRERAEGDVVGSADTCLTATRGWTPFEPAAYAQLVAGSALDAYVYELEAVPGDSFEVDGLAIFATTREPANGVSALPRPIPPSPGRPRYVRPGGCSDRNPGTLQAPWCTLERAFASVEPGERIVLRAGKYDAPAELSRSGTAGAPITVESYPGERALLTEQLVISGSWIRVSGVLFDGRYRLDTTLLWVRGSASNIEISGNEITRAGLAGTTGKDGNGIYSDPGTRNIRILANWIHENGTSAGYHHGVYLNGRGHLVVDNLVEGNAAYGLQLYPSLHTSIVAGNTIVGNGRSGITVGSEEGTPSHGNVIVNNILVGNGEYGISTWWGDGVGSDNLVRNNLIWGNEQGASLGDGVSVAKTIAADPRFVDPEHGDYHLRPGSPAIDRALPGYATKEDFTGQRRVGPPDLGAFEAISRPVPIMSP